MEKKIYKNQNKIFFYIKKIIKSHPYLCVIILHEYFRNLFPHDPHIKFKEKNPLKRIFILQVKMINILKEIEILGNTKQILRLLLQMRNSKKKRVKFMVNFGKHLQKKRIITQKIIFQNVLKILNHLIKISSKKRKLQTLDVVVEDFQMA